MSQQKSGAIAAPTTAQKFKLIRFHNPVNFPKKNHLGKFTYHGTQEISIDPTHPSFVQSIIQVDNGAFLVDAVSEKFLVFSSNIVKATIE
jgi:hypothetical protein